MQQHHVVRIVVSAAVAASVLSMSGTIRSWAQEHPAEHPKAAVKPTVSLEDVAQHIEAYVKEKSKDGVFKLHVHEQKTHKDLLLTLDRVHRERLSQVGPDLFFVCADFKGADGNTYDLDFFVQGTSKENLKVLADKTSVHKENGKERYTWQLNEKTGTWEKKTVGAPGAEHPKQEHP